MRGFGMNRKQTVIAFFLALLSFFLGVKYSDYLRPAEVMVVNHTTPEPQLVHGDCKWLYSDVANAMIVVKTTGDTFIDLAAIRSYAGIGPENRVYVCDTINDCILW